MRFSSFAAIVLCAVALPAVADPAWEHWNVAAKQSKSEPGTYAPKRKRNNTVRGLRRFDPSLPTTAHPRSG